MNMSANRRLLTINRTTQRSSLHHTRLQSRVYTARLSYRMASRVRPVFWIAAATSRQNIGYSQSLVLRLVVGTMAACHDSAVRLLSFVQNPPIARIKSSEQICFRLTNFTFSSFFVIFLSRFHAVKYRFNWMLVSFLNTH